MKRFASSWGFSFRFVAPNIFTCTICSNKNSHPIRTASIVYWENDASIASEKWTVDWRSIKWFIHLIETSEHGIIVCEKFNCDQYFVLECLRYCLTRRLWISLAECQLKVAPQLRPMSGLELCTCALIMSSIISGQKLSIYVKSKNRDIEKVIVII